MAGDDLLLIDDHNGGYWTSRRAWELHVASLPDDVEITCKVLAVRTASEEPVTRQLPCRCDRERAGCPRHDTSVVLFAAPADWRDQYDGADPVRLMETWELRPDLTEEKP